MANLRPVLAALGYDELPKQRAYMKLLEATGALSHAPPLPKGLTDAQADAMLDNLSFQDSAQALAWLHQITQAHWLRPMDKERHQVQDSPELAARRDNLVPLFMALGQAGEVTPQAQHYDHVLVLGATEPAVRSRIDTLARLAASGVTFDNIYLLGCQRPLVSGFEPSAGALASVPGGETETGMMIAAYRALRPNFPPSLQGVPTLAVDTPNDTHGNRANTSDTARSWLSLHPKPGKVLVISNQPHVAYQQAAVHSAVPDVFTLETVGAAAPQVPLSLTLDSLARQIDVGLPKLQAALKRMETERSTDNVVMVPLNQMHTDAAAFQFRSNGDAQGETKDFYIKGHWNPLRHGAPVLLYQRSNGELDMVDGHHRLAFAKREQALGRGPEKLAARILHETDFTPLEARVIGAYINFQQEYRPQQPVKSEHALVDAARVFHLVHSGQVREEVLPCLKADGQLADAYMAGTLSDPAFAYVEKGKVPVNVAARVAGFGIPDTEVQVMEIISNTLKPPAPGVGMPMNMI